MYILNDIEFYVMDERLMFRKDGVHRELDETQRELVDAILERIMLFYPEAYDMLQTEYARLDYTPSLKRLRMVARFCRCNMGAIDDIPDIDGDSEFKFEYVSCPIRTECKGAGVICRPKFNSTLSKAEEKVMRLYCQGLTRDEIAQELYLSPATVNNHIRNAFARLKIHSKSELIHWAEKHGALK